jgi:hypothetical protein
MRTWSQKMIKVIVYHQASNDAEWPRRSGLFCQFLLLLLIMVVYDAVS